MKSAVLGQIRSRNAPSFFAPPLAWAAADFVSGLVAGEGPIDPQGTGLIVASDECSLDVIRALGRSAQRGAISPLKFAGASPSIVAGLPALEQGLRGPTLCLTMPPAHAGPAIRSLIEAWLRLPDVSAVIALAHCRNGAGDHRFDGLIARSAGDGLTRDVGRLTAPAS